MRVITQRANKSDARVAGHQARIVSREESRRSPLVQREQFRLHEHCGQPRHQIKSLRFPWKANPVSATHLRRIRQGQKLSDRKATLDLKTHGNLRLRPQQATFHLSPQQLQRLTGGAATKTSTRQTKVRRNRGTYWLPPALRTAL